jgi:methylglutaconyl-CoA hydratase
MSGVKTEIKDHILRVTLSRPEVHNAFDAKMISEITKIFLQVKKQKSVRAVFLSGEGKSFCAGGDLNWMKSMVNYSKSENQKDALKLFNMFQAVRDCALPIVTYAHGSVFGGGLGLVAASDIIVADEGAQFCFSEVKLGIVPAVISSFVLKKMLPVKVREYMLTGRIFLSRDALSSGLVSYVARELEAKALCEDILKSFLKIGPEAVLHTKKLINDIENQKIKNVAEHSTKLIAERRVSSEGQEGMRAFLNKSKPSWMIAHEN